MEVIKINDRLEIEDITPEASVFLYTELEDNKIKQQKSTLTTWLACLELFKKLDITKEQKLVINKYTYDNLGNITRVKRAQKFYDKEFNLINTLKEKKEVVNGGTF